MKTNTDDESKIYSNYKAYICQHKKYVEKAFSLLKSSLKNYLTKDEFNLLKNNVKIHDNSKFEDDEFYPYANYFYGDKEKNKSNFDKAKFLHKTRNPHHLEYWKNKNEEMPKVYVVEMVLDWWSFSLMKENPQEIFDFYQTKKKSLNLTTKEMKTLEEILPFTKQVFKTK